MKTPRHDPFSDVVLQRRIFKNNQIALLPCFIFMPKTGVIFYCVFDIFSGNKKMFC